MSVGGRLFQSTGHFHTAEAVYIAGDAAIEGFSNALPILGACLRIEDLLRSVAAIPRSTRKNTGAPTAARTRNQLALPKADSIKTR